MEYYLPDEKPSVFRYARNDRGDEFYARDDAGSEFYPENPVYAERATGEPYYARDPSGAEVYARDDSGSEFYRRWKCAERVARTSDALEVYAVDAGGNETYPRDERNDEYVIGVPEPRMAKTAGGEIRRPRTATMPIVLIQDRRDAASAGRSTWLDVFVLFAIFVLLAVGFVLLILRIE